MKKINKGQNKTPLEHRAASEETDKKKSRVILRAISLAIASLKQALAAVGAEEIN